MLKPHKMSSILITGPKNLQESVIKELHDMKVVHIVGHSKNEFADIGKPLESAPFISEMLVKVRALIAELGIKNYELEFELKRGMPEVESTIKKISEELSFCQKALKNAEESISKNTIIKQELEILSGIEVPLESFAPCKSLACFTGYLKGEGMLENMESELSYITKGYMLLHKPFDKKQFIALFAHSKIRNLAAGILEKKGFSPVNFAATGNLKGTASANLARIREEIAGSQGKKAEIKKRIGDLGQEYKGFLLSAQDFLSGQIEKAQAPLMFAATDTSFLIKGWVPSEILKASMERLNRAEKNRIFIHFEPAKKNEKVPVKLKNPPHVRPFEFFMDIYTMPAYNELDPTFFVFLTFPLLFGFMLGDIGYGLVTLILSLTLKKIFPKAKSFFSITMLASLSTMIFGLIFGEFFGYEEVMGLHIPHLLSRGHQITELLYVAVAVGFIHVNAGLAAGFINELNSHGFRHAFFAKISWFVFEAGFVMLMLSIFNFIAISYWFGVGIIALSAVMLFIGEGARGPIEIPGLLSNILSYARLMAIGVSSVKLAELINEMSGQMFHSGGLFIIAGILILAIGHAVNIGLGLMGSFLHSLRLHYVEFFSKFFHGGGEKYKPFGYRD